MNIPSPFRSYPPHWYTFDSYVRSAGAEFFGFVGTVADVNRFAARYRAAKCFRRIEFDEMTTATADGYGALVQLMLTYSAFEHFLRCIGLQLRSSHPLLQGAERDSALRKLRSLQGQSELFAVLRQFLDPTYQRQVDAHLSQQSCNPFYLAAGLRHAFAHGMLTATPGKVPQQTVATVSRFLCRVLFRVIDREFESRMVEFEESLEN